MKKHTFAGLLESLKLFKMGYSWGGFESLVLPFDPLESRTASNWTLEGSCVRFSIGLEDPEDLIADFKLGLDKCKVQFQS